MKNALFEILAGSYRFLFARPRLYPLNKLLFNLSLRGMGLQNYENDRISGEASFLERMLKNCGSPVILDVGANRGSYVEKIMGLCPNARVYAFEPHPATFRELELIARRYGRVEAVNCGMGSEAGTLNLYDRPSSGSGTEHASLYQEVIEGIHHETATATSVRVGTVDAFVAERGLDRITLLKIDTEGHEYQVLQGAGQALANGIVDLIQIEFNEMNVVSRVFFRDFHALLSGGYDIFRLLPSGLLPLDPYRPLQHELFAFQNIVCIRRGSGFGRD